MMNNLRGALLMIGSMGAFAVEDMFIKQMAATLPIGQVLMALGLGGGLIFLALVVMSRQPLVPRELLSRVLIIRNAAEVIGTFGFVTALALIPLSTASSILQSLPLVVTMGAALFLGETVGWRRWTAISVGFLGVLMIVRPGAAGFDPNALYAVLGVLGLGVRDLVTRDAPRNVSSLQMAQWAFLLITPLGYAMMMADGGAAPIPPAIGLRLVAAVFIGALGYYLIVASIRMSDISAVAPFRYSRLVFALAIGVLVFGERPDFPTLAGAALIIASGLYTLARERALFTAARPS